MRFLLDTNVCIRYLNGRSESVRNRLNLTDPQDLATCSIVKAELFYGALKSARPRENLAAAHRFTNRFPSLPFDDRAARAAGEVRVALEKAGQPIGPNDLLIASIALCQELTLVTHNTREFSRVPGLRIEDWED